MTKSFSEYSKHYIPKIEDVLMHYLNDNLDDNRKYLNESMKYSFEVGGKRIRPLMSIATAQLFTENIESIYPVAAAIEMIHTYSLIHDDLPSMDNDDLRRGKPTNHIKFGEDIAILAGDSLNTLAFEIIARDCVEYFDPSNVLNVISYLGKACGIHGMAGGQCLDLKSSAKYNDIELLKKIHKLKTGALLEASITCPALLLTNDTGVIKNIQELGQKVGLLFQIVDDILDVVSDTKTLGKTAQKDIDQEKLTYISCYGLNKAKDIAKEVYDESLLSLNDLKGYNSSTLYELITFIFERTY